MGLICIRKVAWQVFGSKPIRIISAGWSLPQFLSQGFFLISPHPLTFLSGGLWLGSVSLKLFFQPAMIYNLRQSYMMPERKSEFIKETKMLNIFIEIVPKICESRIYCFFGSRSRINEFRLR